jgi:hypothetical protein
MWESHDDFMAMLAQTWQRAGKAHTLRELHNKLMSVAGGLSEWGIHTFGHVRRELKSLNEELDRLRSDTTRAGGPSHAEHKVVERIMELNHREEIMWKQLCGWRQEIRIHDSFILEQASAGTRTVSPD